MVLQSGGTCSLYVVLAYLGADTGVDFEADLSGIKALADALVSTPLTKLDLKTNGQWPRRSCENFDP